jgi:4-amino-4-deoxy-L-arabinose transferase-like glycosyltransferase
MNALTNLWRRNPSACAALLIAIVVALRMAVVIASPLEIGPDEAQYWRWSEKLDFGYYSKPPLIAWVIAASTAVFGDGEWAIRLLSPALHGIAAYFLFLLGKQAFEARIGAWAAAIYLLMPGITLSSTIMSTDAVLLPTVSIALYFLWRFREAPGFSNAILAGAMIGLAMLAKYAALYLYGGAALAALIDRDMRKAILSPAGGVLLLASLVVLAPNLWWNVANDFATVSHTADNANLAEAGFDPLRVFDYLTDQAAVFGPILLLLLLAGFALIAGRKDKWTTTREFWLMCFVVPPLLVIMAQEIMSRAHANWAACAYPAACVLVASWVDRAIGGATSRFKAGPVLKAGLVLNAIMGLLFTVTWISADIADATGVSAGMKGVRGWQQTTTELVNAAKANNASAIMVDDRELWHGIDYYGRDLDMPPLRVWQRGPTPRSHAEEEGKLQPGEDGAILIASTSESLRPMIRADFAAIRELGYVDIPLTPKRNRRFKLFLGSGYSQAPRTGEFEAEYKGKREE